MKAVAYVSPNVVKVVEKEIPKAGEGEAVVKVSCRMTCSGRDLIPRPQITTSGLWYAFPLW